MLLANPDAAIGAFGAALETHDDPTIRACGKILSDQRKLASCGRGVCPGSRFAPPPAKPAASFRSRS